MIENYVPQPLAFYDSPDKQNWKKPQCSGFPESTFKVVCLVSSTNPPYVFRPIRFQIRRPHRANAISYIKLKNQAGQNYDTWNPAMMYVASEPVPGFDYLVYDGVQTTTSGLPPNGLLIDDPYYLEISDGVDTWSSELFYFSYPDPNQITLPESCPEPVYRLRWLNTCSVGNLEYSFGYENWLYLPSVHIGAPEYEIKVEGEEDGQGTFVPTFKRLEKLYRFEIIAPEFIADALSLLPMHSLVTLDNVTGDEYTMKDIKVDVDWQGVACYAKIRVSFRIDFVVSKCC